MKPLPLFLLLMLLFYVAVAFTGDNYLLPEWTPYQMTTYFLFCPLFAAFITWINTQLKEI